MTELGIEKKINFVLSVMPCVYYLGSVLPHLLIFTLLVLFSSDIFDPYEDLFTINIYY